MSLLTSGHSYRDARGTISSGNVPDFIRAQELTGINKKSAIGDRGLLIENMRYDARIFAIPKVKVAFVGWLERGNPWEICWSLS
jgi:hypothetical protein